MKETTFRPGNFAFYDRSAIQARLETMAAEGWMVEKPGPFLWRYRRAQPKKLHFAVTYFPNASDFDPGPTDAQQQMEEYCARDGWVPAVRWGQMQIFYNEGENPVPIETDAVTQVETIHRAMVRNTLPAHLVLIALCAFQLFYCFHQLMDSPAEFLSTPSSLLMLPAWLLILLPTLLELLSYFRWRRRAKVAAESGYFLELSTNHTGSMVLLAVSVIISILSVFSAAFVGGWMLLLLPVTLILIPLAVNAVKKRMKRKGVSRRVNRGVSVAVSLALTFVTLIGMAVLVIRYGLLDDRPPVSTYERHGRSIGVYNDHLPLRIEDFTEGYDIAWSLEQRRDETFLAAHTDYTQWPLSEERGVPDLSYTITDIKVPFLYELCKAGLLNARKDEVVDGNVVLRDSYKPADATPWGAVEAYRLYWSDSYLDKYLLCYETKLVEISFDWEPTPEQMAIVGEKLKNA